MSAYSADKKTLAYRLGESLSQMTDHYLLMTATPHKGDAENFCLFLSLLDKDVYGDVKSLDEAMARREAPVCSHYLIIQECQPALARITASPDAREIPGYRAL